VFYYFKVNEESTDKKAFLILNEFILRLKVFFPTSCVNVSFICVLDNILPNIHLSYPECVVFSLYLLKHVRV
jgi:hypothetical protein